MPKGLLGKKIGMGQHFTASGNAVVVTYVEAGPCVVLQVKNAEKDGYSAVQLGFEKKPVRLTKKPELGHFKKAKSEPLRFVREVALTQDEQLKQGDKISVDMFEQGDFLDVVGVSIGKGFQGGMKRWNWSGGKASHGSMTHRRVGSIGASAYPSRVVKGHHMPGHMGSDVVSIQNLEVIEVDNENNLLVVKGAVPGYSGNYLIIKKALKAKKKPMQEQVAKEEPKGKAVAGKKPAKKK